MNKLFTAQGIFAIVAMIVVMFTFALAIVCVVLASGDSWVAAIGGGLIIFAIIGGGCAGILGSYWDDFIRRNKND